MKLLSLKRICLIIAFAFLFVCNTFSQSLGTQRVAHIKECTFKITIDGSQSVGTGFFIAKDGTFLTCWHVIEPALIRDSATHAITRYKKIFIHLNSDETLEAGILSQVINNSYNAAVGYDYCILKVQTTDHAPFPFLKVGKFDNLDEGQEIYTCGYPLGMQQQFISKGIVSTKYVDTANTIVSNNVITKMPRNEVLLDVTLNKGNSGGAIVKIGKSPKDDEVVGIADFIINPIGSNSSALAALLKRNPASVNSGGTENINVYAENTYAMFNTLVNVINNISIGTNGCISINYAMAGLRKF